MSTISNAIAVRRARWAVGWVWTVLGGLATTALAMAGVYWAQDWFGEPVMSQYVYHFIPVGAIVVGLVAASGYGVVGLWSGTRVSKRAVWVFVALQVVAYFFAEYIEFRRLGVLVSRRTGEVLGFWHYFRLQAESYVSVDGMGHKQSLGGAGYLLRGLEIVAFSAGAGLLGLGLSGGSYCAACGRYRKSKTLAVIPAREFLGEVDEAASDAELERAIVDRGREAFEALAVIAESGDAAVFREQVAAFPAGRLGKKEQGSRLAVDMTYCPGCMEAWMQGAVVVKKSGTSRHEPLGRRRVAVALAEGLA